MPTARWPFLPVIFLPARQTAAFAARRWRRSVFLSLLLSLVFLTAVRGQAEFEVIDPKADFDFGERITFRATIKADPPVDEVLLFFRPEGPYETFSRRVPIDASGQAVYIHELAGTTLPPFSTVHFWFQLETASGEQQVSSSSSFIYEDDRFDWRVLQDPPFRVHWYTGDAIFAQKVADTAHLGLRKLNEMLSDEAFDLSAALAARGLDIYVYSTISDLQFALAMGGTSWIAGHADPELGVALVSLPPGPEQTLEMERQVPHEIAHIALYTRYGPGYYSLPVWLNEGLASVSELYPNLNYQILLDSAAENKVLIPLEDLCDGFPAGASQVVQAYAESTAFTGYLVQEYGNRNLQALLQAYADGKSCLRGAEEVYAKSLTQLDREWRSAALGENSLVELLPWFAIPLIILAPLLLAAVLFARRAANRPGSEDAGSPPEQGSSAKP